MHAFLGLIHALTHDFFAKKHILIRSGHSAAKPHSKTLPPQSINTV